MKPNSPTLEKVRNYKITLIGALLYECTMPQREKFMRIHQSVENAVDTNFEHAVLQIENTIKKNKKATNEN